MEVIVAESGQTLRDAVAVQRLARENRQDHQIECALRDVQLLHAVPSGLRDDAQDSPTPLGCQDDGPHELSGATLAVADGDAFEAETSAFRRAAYRP